MESGAQIGKLGMGTVRTHCRKGSVPSVIAAELKGTRQRVRELEV